MPSLTKQLSILCALGGLFLASSCSRKSENFDLLQTLPIPQGVYEVQKIHLGGFDRNQELFFKIDRRYPAADVLNLYGDHFRLEQWVTCHPYSEGWNWFLDKSSDPPRYVHQNQSYWINLDRQLFAAVAGFYYSKALTTSNAPDNSVQSWAILVQKDIDPSAEVKRLSLRCDNSESVKPQSQTKK